MSLQNNNKINRLRFIIEAAIIGALYAALTLLFAPLSYGIFQVRISESLTILPAFTPAAIPGLFIGCAIANIIGGNGIHDVVFGSLATLIAAGLSYKMPKSCLVPLPPIIINAVIVGFVLFFVFKIPLFSAMIWIALGQAVACYGLGYPLMKKLEKYKDKLFKTYS